LKWLLSIDLKEVVIDEIVDKSCCAFMDKIFTCGAQIIYGHSGLLDPALNWITGRKAMLKKRSYC
jgi:hypothetical protein